MGGGRDTDGSKRRNLEISHIIHCLPGKMWYTFQYNTAREAII